MPVATTVTHTWPVSLSSIVAPKMMFVSSVAALRIASAASLTSISVMSSPPAIESRIPLAPVISSSISGERSARSAASLARLSVPEEKPIPISAVPASLVSGRASHVRVGAGAETLGEVAADVDLHGSVAHVQRLHVGVHGDELDLIDAGVDHPVDGVETRASDPDHLDHREIRAGVAARD